MTRTADQSDLSAARMSGSAVTEDPRLAWLLLDDFRALQIVPGR
jgi:hypothetical protein